MTREDQRVPGHHTVPDVYHDPKEVIWKHIAFSSYTNVSQLLENEDVLDDPEVARLRTRTIHAFNSNASQEIFCTKAEVLRRKLERRLQAMGKGNMIIPVDQEIQQARANIASALAPFNADVHFATTDQTYIRNGVIEIAGMPIEEFSNQQDYFIATLQLFSEKDDRNRALVESSFRHGFSLDPKDEQLILRAKKEKWDLVDLITQQLLTHQIEQGSRGVQAYEYVPDGDNEQNRQRKQGALTEAYYFIGKIMSTVARYSNDSETPSNERSGVGQDPLALFLQAAGKPVSPQQLIAIKKIALAHSSHGLNSGELTAQLAGSVRTTFPRALIAGFNIRSGVLHAGAVDRCMRQTADFLSQDTDADTYVQKLVTSGDNIYGFGHRIHKTDPTDPITMLGKDPRVTLYIKACVEAFPEKANQIKRLIEYASAIRKARPSLGANTDFGASVLFHSLDLSPNLASGFFAAFRIPGICAQIVNELSFKGNSRRPPFPPVLRY